MIRSRNTLVVVGIVAVVLGIYPLDWMLSRSGRIEYSRMGRDLMTVRDELLRYQYETGDIPKDLQALIPSYLRKDQLYDGGTALYDYSPDDRWIATGSGLKIWGLWRRALPVIAFRLPRAQSTRESEAVPNGSDPAIADDDGPIELISPEGPPAKPTPKDALVFEAELYSETNYGWEVRPDPTASGGAYIHSKEGIANSQGQIDERILDFYNLKKSEEYTTLKYHIHIPESGQYSIYGRFWTTSSHCSNTIYLRVDNDWSGAVRHSDFSDKLIMENRSPFQWVWTQAGHETVYFKEGDHVLTFFLHEDGVRLDQLMLCKHLETGGDMYQPNLTVNSETRFLRERAPFAHMMVDLKSAVISKTLPPQANVFLRRFKKRFGKATMTVVLEGTNLVLEESMLMLDDLPVLAYHPIDFSAVNFDALNRREYALAVCLTQNGEILASVRVPLMHVMKWDISSQTDYLWNYKAGPLDGALESDSMSWEPMKDRSWTHFGVIDFGLQTINNSLQAPQMSTIYAKTRIAVPETKEYLLKIQSDDQMILWIDGKFVYFHEQRAPVTRSAKRLKLTLGKGEHDIRMRVNQRQVDSYGDGRWQAYLRFRSVDDDLCGIRWAPYNAANEGRPLSP